MAEIVYIPIGNLIPHPDNPRKDIGDVTELADSIKAKGVLQNLTVVPHFSELHNRVIQGMYNVVIGHRRLAAAELAGLKELPCVIVDMSYEDQIATMLVENMQRSDLTVYEEAKGIKQLMMDLGKSAKEVSDITGFSETTVRHRAKLAELDERKFKKAVDRGATLFDFIELESIEDPERKAELLDVIGTKDFRNKLSQVKQALHTKELLTKAEEKISQWATKVDDLISGYPDSKALINGEEIRVKYCRNYGQWNLTKNALEEIAPPGDAATVKYFYRQANAYSQIDLYKEWSEEDLSDERQAQLERERIREAHEEKKARFQQMTDRHRELRMEFIKNFNAYQKRDVNVFEFLSESLLELRFMATGYYTDTSKLMPPLADFLGITWEPSIKELKYHEFMSIKNQQPERTAVLIAYWFMDSGEFWTDRWNGQAGRYEIAWQENKRLEKLVKLLTYLGYQESTEETELRRGTLKALEVTSEDVMKEKYAEDEEEDED